MISSSLPPLEQSTRLIVCSLCILSIFNLVFFPISVLRAGVLSVCISSWSLLTFYFVVCYLASC